MSPQEYLSRVWSYFYGKEPYPDSYLCLDLETTGLKFDYLDKWSRNMDVERPSGDLILQYALLYVKGGQPERCDTEFLAWTRSSPRIREMVRQKLEFLVATKRAQGKRWPVTLEMVDGGSDPLDALDRLGRCTEEWQNQEGWLAGVNLCSFDLGAIANSLAEWRSNFKVFDESKLLDPGAIIKGWQARIFPDRQYDGIGHFLCELAKIPLRGVYWGVDFLVEHFHLKPLLRERSTHLADVDCYVTHWCLESLFDRKQGIPK